MLSRQNLYSLSKEAKAHASAGDLKYFEDLKQKMGEEDFRAFVKNQYYKKGDVSVPDILPDNLLLSAALGESGNNLEVAMFLVQNGAAVQTKKMFTMLHKSSYYGTCSEILDLIIAGNGDLLVPPFKRFTYTNIDLLEYDIMNTVEIALSCDNVSALHKIRTYLENYDYTKFSNQEITVGKKKESLSKLLKHYPNLTVNERRLCAFLNMNLTTKEISAITRQSVQSINTARTRLRRKLGLKGGGISIQEFISRL